MYEPNGDVVFYRDGKEHWRFYATEPKRDVFKEITEGFDALLTDYESLSKTTKETTDYDIVSKPKHYMLFEEQGIEVRDVIEKLLLKFTGNEIDEHKPMFISDYVQMMQYLMRFMDKNGKQDLEKARWYLDKLIEAYDQN